MSAGTEVLRSVLENLPHVWCERYGWHDPATHDEDQP